MHPSLKEEKTMRSYSVHRTTLWALAAVAALMAPTARAEQSVGFGEFVIHYNALSTDVLVPEVAQRYGITRSKSQVLLNVAVLKNVAGTAAQPTTAKLTAHARNLNNQLSTLEMREVLDQGAIYYLGTTRVSDGDTLTFTIDVVPEGTGKPLRVEFRQEFFTR
jgi:hypothetical protein